jgi:hypothetical protein
MQKGAWQCLPMAIRSGRVSLSKLVELAISPVSLFSMQ